MGKIKIGSSKELKGITINPDLVKYNGNNVKKIIYRQNSDIIWSKQKVIYSNGDEPSDIKISALTSNISVTRNTNTITASLGNGQHGLAGIQIDLTNYSTVKFIGKIDSLNESLGHILVSSELISNWQWKQNSPIYYELTTSEKEYILDVSSLTGQYYVGFAGSSRTVTCSYLSLS